MTLFSVCMCTFNGATFLEKQLNSIISQTAFNFANEILICDDLSTDSTIDILRSFSEKYSIIKYVVNEKQLGPQKNFEKVLSWANSEYLVLCDQDDLWHPNKLQVLAETIHRNSFCQVFVHDASLINEDDDVLHTSYMSSYKGGFSSSIFSNFVSNKYLGCSMVIKANLLELALPFPAISPQHDIWIGIWGSTFGSTLYIDKSLTFYRTHYHNASPASQNKRGSVFKIIEFRFRFLACVIICTIRYIFQKK